jgi:hypothetical protein
MLLAVFESSIGGNSEKHNGGNNAPCEWICGHGVVVITWVMHATKRHHPHPSRFLSARIKAARTQVKLVALSMHNRISFSFMGWRSWDEVLA